MNELGVEAQLLADCLAASRARLVLAESCTAGLGSASLAMIPGISAWLCGSAVTYREATKVRWLGVNAADLAEKTAVSDQITQQMAVGVLEKTPEADLAGAITGHLGPDAPLELDGVVFVVVCRRRLDTIEVVSHQRHVLGTSERISRQRESAMLLMQQIRQSLTTSG